MIATHSTFRGVPAIIMESEALRVVILPEHGAKTASMSHKKSGREVLLQGTTPLHPTAPYAAGYDRGDVSGFDEMFPTINQCPCHVEPWLGTMMPDHGEVWALPWKWRQEGASLHFSVHGIRFPYHLEKTVHLEGDCLYTVYQVQNLSPFPLPFLWAAHPLFNAEEGMTFDVPPGANRIRSACASIRLGEYASLHDFPQTHLPDGAPWRLDTMPPSDSRGYVKYYFEEPLREGWCRLRYPSDGVEVRMEFPTEVVPWLGVWLNEGGVLGQYCIAPEPATAPMDQPDIADRWGRGSVLPPNGTRSWWLRLRVS